jgi:hypothetical protein
MPHTEEGKEGKDKEMGHGGQEKERKVMEGTVENETEKERRREGNMKGGKGGRKASLPELMERAKSKDRHGARSGVRVYTHM